MNRNYENPNINSNWAGSRETHIAVATAIHAIADKIRTPEAIWEAPTPAEWNHVEMAVAEYIAHGDFEPKQDCRYFWGQETVFVKGELK